MGEILDLGVQANIIEKAGAWFSYGGQRIGQGRENAKKFLRENPNMTSEIEHVVRKNAGVVSNAMLEGMEEDDNKGA